MDPESTDMGLVLKYQRLLKIGSTSSITKKFSVADRFCDVVVDQDIGRGDVISSIKEIHNQNRKD